MATFSTIAKHIEAFGAGILCAPYAAVTWAARQVAETHGEEFARAQLYALNKHREKMGGCWVYSNDCGL